MEGATVLEVPVNHRPRAAGTAKYGMWNRVFRATADLFGIRWMKSRVLGYEIEREAGEGLRNTECGCGDCGVKKT